MSSKKLNFKCPTCGTEKIIKNVLIGPPTRKAEIDITEAHIEVEELKKELGL